MEEVIKLYKAGLSSYKISKELNISATQIRRILHKNKVEIRSTKTSNEIEKEILRRYELGESSEEIAKTFEMNGSTVCRIVKRLGGEIRPGEENKRIYNIRQDYFNKIDTEEKAYLLGFLYADGSISKNRNSIKIEVHEQDSDILDKFINAIFIDNKPKISTDQKIYKYITITSKYMKEDLIAQGCVPNKTFLVTMPKLEKEMINHFFRGVYDGDGSIAIGSNKRVRVCLTGYDKFLTEVGNILFNNDIVPRYQQVKPKVSNLIISKKADVIKCLDFLYKDSSIYLNRKYAKYLEAKSIL